MVLCYKVCTDSPMLSPKIQE